MERATLTPRIGTRFVIVGRTGCGKSVLARVALQPLLAEHHVVIIDPKAAMSPFNRETAAEDGAIFVRYKEETGVYTTPETLFKGGNSLLCPNGKRIRIYQPSPKFIADPEAWERIFAWVYEEKNRVLYIDETYAVCNSAISYPHSLRGIFTQGRSRKITVIALVQRPRDVPNFIFSEANTVALFQCNLPDDRKKVAGLTHGDLNTNVVDFWDEYGDTCHLFWYYDGKRAKITEVKLNG